jgi:hypothetical protein
MILFINFWLFHGRDPVTLLMQYNNINFVQCGFTKHVFSEYSILRVGPG